jgi:hypothetical protein
MNLLNTHNHRLVFYLDGYAPEKYIKKWNEFKLKCECDDNKYIIEQIKEFSKNLHYLESVEGGDNNVIHKQFNGGNIPYYKKDNIIVYEIISMDIETWNYDDLDYLIYAFIKIANYNVGSEWVTGYIEMKNKTMFSDIYLDSNSE